MRYAHLSFAADGIMYFAREGPFHGFSDSFKPDSNCLRKIGFIDLAFDRTCCARANN